jgi:hypothetical protein
VGARFPYMVLYNCGTTIWVVVAQMVYIGTTRPSLEVGYTVRRIQDDRSPM